MLNVAPVLESVPVMLLPATVVKLVVPVLEFVMLRFAAPEIPPVNVVAAVVLELVMVTLPVLVMALLMLVLVVALEIFTARSPDPLMGPVTM